MKLPLWAWLVVDALATFRLTRLVCVDTLTDGARRWVGGFDGDSYRRRGAFFFVTCPWCVSVWLAAGVVALTRLCPGPWSYVALAGAFSAVAGVLAERT